MISFFLEYKSIKKSKVTIVLLSVVQLPTSKSAAVSKTPAIAVSAVPTQLSTKSSAKDETEPSASSRRPMSSSAAKDQQAQVSDKLAGIIHCEIIYITQVSDFLQPSKCRCCSAKNRPSKFNCLI